MEGSLGARELRLLLDCRLQCVLHHIDSTAQCAAIPQPTAKAPVDRPLASAAVDVVCDSLPAVASGR